MKKHILLSVALLGMWFIGVSHGAMMDDTMKGDTMMTGSWTMMEKTMKMENGMMKEDSMMKEKMMMDEKMMKTKMMYQDTLGKFSDEKIKKISMKLEEVKAKINASKLSEKNKARLLEKLWIIEEIIKEKMSMMEEKMMVDEMMK